jgi:hypothetical protein
MVSHCDDADLSLIALGESPEALDEQHLAGCPHCRSRLDQLSAVVSAARSIEEADRPVPPPPDVWEGIVAELGLDAMRVADPTDGTATVTPIAQARSTRGRTTWLVAAAAAVIGLIVGGTAVAGLTSTRTSNEVVATADLAPFADSGFSGTAVVSRTDGGATLTVTVPDLPQVTDGYYEVWMATPDTATMVAIGTLNPGQQATFELPAGMAVDSFPVVDVSVERFDGQAGHSDVSVVRGRLQA